MKRFLNRVTAILLCLVLSCSLLPVTGLAASSHPFRDVPDSHWANSAVAYVYDNSLMNGTGPNTFTPSGTLTRAMFVTILGRMDGVNTASYPGTSFSDVPAGQWYSPYVAWACRQGIVTGTGNGQFSPNTPVTREQMAAMIARYVEASGVSLPDADNPVGSFKDAASVSSWARDGLELMRRTGILSGYSDGTFGPKKTATRAEAATIFMRLCGRLDGETPDKEPDTAEKVITGKVTDSKTNQPLSGVKVTLTCIFGAGGEAIGATYITGKDGTFLLKIPENATGVTKVQFEKDGYKEGSCLLTGTTVASYNIGTCQMNPAANPEVLYQDVLSDYRSALSYLHRSGADFYFIEKNDAMKLYPSVRYLPSYPDESLYYAFHDIDNNGVPELVIGGETTTGEIEVEDIFSCNGTTPVHLLPVGNVFGAPYTPSIIYTSGEILTIVWVNADIILIVRYVIAENGFTCSERENAVGIWSFLQGEGDMLFSKNCTYQYKNDMIVSLEASEESMTREQFNRWSDGLYDSSYAGSRGNQVSFNWTAF